MNLELYSGLGNRFLLTEQPGPLPRAAELARVLCAPGRFESGRVDGLLVLEEAPGEPPRMTIFNGDGSRPGACGNGLRCAGWHLARRDGLKEIWIRTDSGDRLVRLVSRTGRRNRAVPLSQASPQNQPGSTNPADSPNPAGPDHRTGLRATLTSDMGPVEIARLQAPAPPVPGLLDVRRAWLGNPHAVLLVEDERGLDTRAISAGFDGHPDFPDGVNVGFLSERDGAWHLRVYERGVGETEACGTGATAAAATIAELGLSRDRGELNVHMPGGPLTVTLGSDRRASLLGEAESLGPLTPAQLQDCGVPWAISSLS